MSNIYTSADQLIGRTPILELAHIEKNLGLKAKLLAKLEYFNPAGSVKDRIAKAMIDDAEANGTLKPDSVIIEPTSGNTGIGLAAVAASKGYRTIFTMPDTMSIERRNLLSAYGAEIVLTDGKLGMKGAIEKAEELAKELNHSFIPSQFENPSNPKAHFETTGPEIWTDTDGKVDAFAAGVGTGGTVSGTGKFLKEKNPDIKIIAIEPKNSPLLTEGRAGAHGLQGIGANFVPDTLDREVLDEVITVSEEDAYNAARQMAKLEGILVGISSGAALYAATEVAKRPEMQGKAIVVLLPDTGERYMSTDLFK
ncbi:MAG: cysteine synthase A [Oscillospiraceae bacterium]|nr:cysteine synthase A [Oscillospiraceae bacterium]